MRPSLWMTTLTIGSRILVGPISCKFSFTVSSGTTEELSESSGIASGNVGTALTLSRRTEWTVSESRPDDEYRGVCDIERLGRRVDSGATLVPEDDAQPIFSESPQKKSRLVYSIYCKLARSDIQFL